MGEAIGTLVRWVGQLVGAIENAAVLLDMYGVAIFKAIIAARQGHFLEAARIIREEVGSFDEMTDTYERRLRDIAAKRKAARGEGAGAPGAAPEVAPGGAPGQPAGTASPGQPAGTASPGVVRKSPLQREYERALRRAEIRRGQRAAEAEHRARVARARASEREQRRREQRRMGVPDAMAGMGGGFAFADRDQQMQARFEGLQQMQRRIQEAAASGRELQMRQEREVADATKRNAKTNEESKRTLMRMDNHIMTMSGTMVEVRDRLPARSTWGA
jgi:hypothetical protein